MSRQKNVTKAFGELKRKLGMYHISDSSNPGGMKAYSDASNHGFGCVLT